MNILMVSDVFPNNVKPNLGTFCLERLKSLKKHAEIKVVAAVPYFPKWPILKRFKRWHDFARVKSFEKIENTEVFHPRRIVIPKMGGATSGDFYFKTLKKCVHEILETYPVDLIDAHFVWPDGYAAAKVAELFDIPICITAHGTDINLMPQFKSIRPLIIETIDRADRIIAVSQALANIMYDLNYDRNKIKVINNGVDLSKFRRIDKSEAREYLNLDQESTILISIGALIPRKAHEYLIEALDILVNHQKRKNLKLLIIGDGENRKELADLIKEKRLEDNARLVGSISHNELYMWLSASDLFCLTSRREGWPTVFFESWACGVPVVATAVHGAPEAICSDKYGLLIDKHDSNLTAEIIDKALSMPWNPKEMIAYAEENSWDKVVEKMFHEMKLIVHERKKDQVKVS